MAVSNYRKNKSGGLFETRYVIHVFTCCSRLEFCSTDAAAVAAKEIIELHEMTRLHVRSCADEHATTTQQLSGWLEQNVGATPGAGAYTVSYLPVLTTTIELINQSINLFFQLRGQRHTKCILQTRHK